MAEPNQPLGCIHLDLDGAAAIFAAHGWSFSGEDTLYRSGLEGALGLLDRFGLHATFFVIANDLDDPERLALLRRAAELGHDFGSHTWTHSDLVGLPAASRRREIIDSKARIEDVLGVEVRGFRAPMFSLDREALDLVLEAGYDFDSSLFANRRSARAVGLDQVPRDPHPLCGSEHTWELPLPGHAPLPFPWHPSYALVVGERYFETGLERFHRTGAPLVLLFHLTDFAHPLADASGFRQKLFTVSFRSRDRKLEAGARMLSRVRARYRVVKTMRLLDQARGRIAGARDPEPSSRESARSS